MVRWVRGALLESITIDRSVPQRLSLQISNGLRDLILSGAFRSGERLPATRILAQELEVSRATIVDSFERLVAEGMLETHVGAGTYVARILPSWSSPRLSPKPETLPPITRPGMATAAGRFGTRLIHEPRPFTTAMPAFEAFPIAQWARLMAKHWRGRRSDILGYPEPLGYRPLRKAIAAHLRVNRGISCDWQDVIVVAGAQQAFHLIGSTLAAPGDRVWFEDPGAIGARNSLILAGLEPVPVPVDVQGLDVEAGAHLAPDFRLAFVTPAHQQPLGVRMSLDRRLALLRTAGAAGAFIIEDDWDGEFSLSGRPVPPLRSLDSAGRVVYVGTFSKSLFPALRLGFLIAPGDLGEHFRASLDCVAPGVPTAIQGVVADFLDEGYFVTHIRRMRKLYADRYQTLQAAAQEHLAEWLDIQTTESGLHTLGWLKPPLLADEIANLASARGLTLTPLSRFAERPQVRQGFAIGFSGFSKNQILDGVRVLRDIFHAHSAARQGASAKAGAEQMV
jgi:GntR family transcriptional regulator/MocR family aminotransferase